MVMLIIAVVNAQEEVENPERMVYAAIGGPETMDPHWSYDSASGEIIFQVYDNLIAYDGESLSEFVPMLSTEVPSAENGMISEDGLTYTFPIRKEVKFHNDAELTPEDVEYSVDKKLTKEQKENFSTKIEENKKLSIFKYLSGVGIFIILILIIYPLIKKKKK